MTPASLVIMFANKRKLRIALGLILWTSLAVAQNASEEGVSGRVGNQVDLAGSATAKSFEPPPEFYRGPGSGQGSQSSPSSGSGSHPSLGSVGESLSETYNKWRTGGANLQDRISVGHYGAGGGVASHAPTVGSFESNSHPYPYEYSHNSGGGGGGAGLGGVGGSGAYFGSSSVEAGIPFDVYGSRPGHGASHGHYYSPPEYVHPYPLDPHEIAAHKGPGHGDVSSKALLAKSFLIPLASAAVLGIAAALVSNPLLLQLGTVSGLGTIVGKRKRRATGRNLLTNKPINTLYKYAIHKRIIGK